MDVIEGIRFALAAAMVASAVVWPALLLAIDTGVRIVEGRRFVAIVWYLLIWAMGIIAASSVAHQFWPASR